MIAATTLCAGAATSQETPTVVLNEQLQLGDVISGQTLNVVDSDDQVTASTVATGNTLSGAVENGVLQLQSSQTMLGDAAASTVLNLSGEIDGSANLTSHATGNAGDAGAYGADMTVNIVQVAGAVAVTADTEVNGTPGRILEGGSANATAMANSQALGMSAGRTEGLIDQSSAATTQAVTTGVIQYIPAGVSFSAAAVSNNMASTGAYGSQELEVRQEMTGDRTQASTIVSTGNAWDLQGAANATGNNATVYNQGGSLYMTADQSNAAYVRSESVVSAYDFGAVAATAYGAGNAMEAGNNDVLVVIDNSQLNTGGVEAVASFAGQQGYDVALGATAIGNTATGYACSECPGYLDANNTQTNSANVTATVSGDINGASRAVIGSATAVGNSATFYVTGDGGG